MSERGRMQELKHDIANDLAVIRMGLEALASVREDASEFSEVMKMVVENVDQLKGKVETLVRLVERADENDSGG